jgi:aldose 1-epimerase
VTIQESKGAAGPDGEILKVYTLASPNGLAVKVTNYGGIITSILAPDRDGANGEVALGFGSVARYLGPHPYFGAIIGRIAGRLTPPWFEVKGHRYHLAANQSPHHLHGGRVGFDRRVWGTAVVPHERGEALVLSYRSSDGEEGYPGNVEVKVSYAVSDDNALSIHYEASTDQETPLSLTNHSYFNLGGPSSDSVTGHQFQILADEYTPVGPDFSHTGQRRSVQDLANDFRRPALLSARLGGLFGRHGDNYLLRRERTAAAAVARVFAPQSGRLMDVQTTAPCLQFYTGVNLDGTVPDRRGGTYERFAGFCLECQGYPAAPHFPAFETIMISPTQRYRQETSYRFGATDSMEMPPLG